MKVVDLRTLFRALRREGGRLVGLDWGEKYVGVAVSDPTCSMAFPHSVMLLRQSTPVMSANALEILVKKYSISGLVIGYPTLSSEDQRKQAAMVDAFIEELHKTQRFANLHVFLENERFTTLVVRNLIEDMNIESGREKRILDKFAAVCILQRCLDRLSHYANEHCSENIN